MGRPEHDCTEYVELIAQHLDGLLPAHAAERLESHLADCSVCRAELVLQKRIREALTEEIHPRLSVDFTRMVTERMEAAEAAERPARRRFTRLSLVPVFGLLALAVLVFALPNGFGTVFGRALLPTGSALASAARGLGHVFQQIIPAVGSAHGLDPSRLAGITGPVMLALLLILCVLPVVWCFKSVGEVLRH